MNFQSRQSRFLTILIFLLVVGAFGCAKKNRPDDPNAMGNVLGKDVIVDKDLEFTPTGSDSGKIEGLYTIHFDYDKVSLTEKDRDLLVKNAQWMKAHPKDHMQIEGHCDRHGSIEYNMALGERRAKVVKSYMENLGVSSKRISTISYGKEKLLDNAETEEADSQNRRANFKPLETVKVNKS